MKAFNVLAGGKKKDLLGSLEATQVMGHSAWKAAYPVKRPGVYMFYHDCPGNNLIISSGYG